MEGLRELVNNHSEVVTFLIIVYVFGVIYKISRNIIKEKNNKKR